MLQELLDIRTITITGKGQVAIPKELRLAEGFKEGQRVAIIAFGDRLEIRPLEQVRKAVNLPGFGAKASLASERTLAKAWTRKREDRAWKDL